MTQNSPPDSPRRPASPAPAAKGLARFAPVLAIAAALAIFFALDLDRYFSLDALRDNRLALKASVDAAPLRALALFILVYAGAVAISFPGASILTVFGGYLFGLALGTPAVVIAATLGASIVFFAAKGALADTLKKRISGFSAEIEKGFRADELNYMFVLRLAPVFPFWAVNIAAGVLGVSFRNFLIGTFFGIIPGSFVYASIGNAAGAAFDAGETLSLGGILLKPATLIPIVGLIALSLVPIIAKRFGAERKRDADAAKN